MTKQEFMKELKEALEEQMPEKEIVAILADYEGFFTEGLNEGNTEEEVAHQLGHPARIALSLLSKEGNGTFGKIPKTPALPAPSYKRFIALVIDNLISVFPILFLAPRTGLIAFFIPQFIPHFLASFYSTILISNHNWIANFRLFWLAGLFFSGFWFFFLTPVSMAILKGQTPGKKLTGVKVVSVTGARASFIQIFVREWVGKLAVNMVLSAIWFPLAIIAGFANLMVATFTKEGVTLWDIMAGTRVVPIVKRRI